ncbi:hypothetical protein EV121DRAFT_251317 [Schizophyllum commune]
MADVAPAASYALETTPTTMNVDATTPMETTTTAPVPTEAVPAPSSGLINPVPLSFPAILRTPGVPAARYELRDTAYVRPSGSIPGRAARKEDVEGKRRTRRKENAKFTGNPHIVAATKRDLVLEPPTVRTTFPEPLPPSLPRTAKLPSVVPPTLDPLSANAGRFSLSLKGMRRELRKSGYAQGLVRVVELEMADWLADGGAMLSPDEVQPEQAERQIGETPVVEVSRTPLQLVWRISEDSYARYVVHCCARYHEIVSFSKDVDGQRLTYLLRPNVFRPDAAGAFSLETPPVTDIDYSSQLSESDLVSSDAGDTDIEERCAGHAPAALPAISEDRPASPADSSWSIVDDAASADGDESASDAGLAASVESLSLADERTPRRRPLHPAAWGSRQSRADSSPSPARRQRRRRMRPADNRRTVPARRGVTAASRGESFYDYIFS